MVLAVPWKLFTRCLVASWLSNGWAMSFSWLSEHQWAAGWAVKTRPSIKRSSKTRCSWDIDGGLKVCWYAGMRPGLRTKGQGLSECSAECLVWLMSLISTVHISTARPTRHWTFASKASTYGILIFLSLTTSLSGEIDKQLASSLILINL